MIVQTRVFQEERKKRMAAEAEVSIMRAQLAKAEERARQSKRSGMAAMARGCRVKRWCDDFVLYVYSLTKNLIFLLSSFTSRT